MNASKYIFLSLILYYFAINFAFANDNILIISPENNDTSSYSYQTNHQLEKIIINNNKKTENTNKIQFEDDNSDEEIIKVEQKQNNHTKNESVPNRKTHSNIKKNNDINIIEDEMEIDIASDSSVAVTENEVKKNTEDTLAASTINNNETVSDIVYEAKLIEFNIQDKTKEHIENQDKINFNYNNLLYYLLYVFSLLFIFCFIGLIKEIIKRKTSKMKDINNVQSN